MKLYIYILLLLCTLTVDAQVNLLVEGIDSVTTTHNGYNIDRTSQINFIFRYNRMRTALGDGYLLAAGTNNYTPGESTNLDGAQIYGTRFISTNTSPSGSLHGVMAGYNRNYDFHHNYIMTYSYGFTHEGGHPDHTSMTSTSGGVYYNIFKNNKYHLVEKGYDGTRIINNTFYTTLSSFGYFISVKYSDTGGLPEPYPPSANVKIYNNIFYNDGTYTNLFAINLGNELDTVGFRCDYNIYYYSQSVNNEPLFAFKGSTYTWSQWRALGYDEHSIILDPNFIDTDEFVPTNRIDFGIALTGFETGLSAENTTWTVGQMPATNRQGEVWQPGARIYESPLAADFYVAPDGDDDNPGTYAEPWATWGKAFNSTAVQPGDTVYFRGGVYSMTSNDLAYPYTTGSGYNFGRDGTAGNYIYYMAYPGEQPILDCGNISLASGTNRGIVGNEMSYIHLKGLTLRNVNQPLSGSAVTGWTISGNDIVVENCTVHNTGGWGFESIGTNIHYINCDSYNNCDSLTSSLPGNDGVGFQNVNQYEVDGSVYYDNCRAWLNGDQGFSAVSIGYLEFNNCWSFNNGQLQGEGHGFKMASVGSGGDQPEYGPLKRRYTNNIAVYNRANGFTTNDSYPDRTFDMQVYNNLAYHNGYPTSDFGMSYGFVVYNTASTDAEELSRVFRNNIAYDNLDGSTFIAPGALYTHSNNSWDGGATVDASDFAALPATQNDGIALLMGSRGSDGSLPSLGNYFHLAEGSDLIDAGIDVGLSYSGSAPDIGAFEYDGDIDSTLTDILTFTLPTQTGAATINSTNHTVAIEVNYLATLTNLAPFITVSEGATISPASMTSRDFTNPQTYTVTALDGTTTQNWTVTVTQEEEPYVPPEVDTSRIIKFNGGHLRKFRP